MIVFGPRFPEKAELGSRSEPPVARGGSSATAGVYRVDRLVSSITGGIKGSGGQKERYLISSHRATEAHTVCGTVSLQTLFPGCGNPFFHPSLEGACLLKKTRRARIQPPFFYYYDASIRFEPIRFDGFVVVRGTGRSCKTGVKHVAR